MEYTNSKTVTLSEYQSIYGGDSINIHDELVNGFKALFPDAIISVSAGELIEVDGGFSYELTIQYTI